MVDTATQTRCMQLVIKSRIERTRGIYVTREGDDARKDWHSAAFIHSCDLTLPTFSKALDDNIGWIALH